MTKLKKESKPAQSFRLGAHHRQRLEDIAQYRDEAQVEVLRTMIDVAYKAMQKRREERQARKATG